MKRLIPILVFLSLVVPASSDAQFFYFGRNKVNYTNFEWHVLRTEHFDIYYYPEMEDLARRGAFFAEEAYSELVIRFNHTLNDRVPLIFYSSHIHFQQTNTTGGFIPEGVGGFFEFLKGRVVIPSDGSSGDFRHVIRHELVHVLMHSKVGRVLVDHRKPQDRFPPLWFTEGLAEYWSTSWDAQAEMVLRDAVLSDIIVGLDDMDRIYGSFLMYKEGQAALQYIAETYGHEKIRLLMENFWKASSFNDVLKLTIGKNFSEFDEEWLYALKKKYYPLLAEYDTPSYVTWKITTEGFNSKPVLFEPDSTRKEVYFIGNRTGYTGIYKRDLREESEGKETLVIEGEQSSEFESFHPFRSRIDVSRNGILAFVTKSGEQDVLHLYNVVEERMEKTVRFKDLVSIGSVSWSPDGDRISFSSIDKSGNNDLYIYRLETGELVQLTRDYYDDRDPAWSPDGTVIAFSSDRTADGLKGVHNLFLYRLDTGVIEYLACGEKTMQSPAWSKDGSMLAFTSDAGGGAQNIWVVRPHEMLPGGKRTMTRVTNFTTAAFDPAWSSEGDLLFSAFENFSFQIRMVEDVKAVRDTSTAVLVADLTKKGTPWTAAQIGGTTEPKTYRYEGEYSLDFAQSAISTDPVFGTTGGAAVAMSDLLGNDQYYFLLYNTAQSQDEILSSFNLAISRVSLGQRVSYAYGVYRFSGRRYDITDRDEFYYERAYGGYFSLSYPLSKFDRIESTVSMTNSNKEIEGTFQIRNALLLSNSLSIVHDNSLWGPSGPIDGNRFSVTVAYTSDIQYSNVNYYSIIADYRHYMRLALRSALATRLWVFYNDGREPRRFFMGGSWDLRGYRRWSLRGEKLWLMSHELRFPFIDQFAVRFPFGGLSFWSIRGALFFDAGGAWDDVYLNTYGAIGGGLRMNLGGVLVLRYDLGKRIENNFNTLQKGLFHEFFFGWDF